MTRTFVKSIIVAGVAAGFVLTTTAGAAYPAAKPPTPDPRKPVRAVAVYNQSVLVAQGLSPKAALKQAKRFLPYPMTTVHYMPKGFRLAYVRVYPFIPGVSVPQDTQTFLNFAVASKLGHGKVVQVPDFEVDHQADKPYVYLAGAFFTLSTVKLGSRKASVAEQKYHDVKTHQAVDLIYVYWYDSKHKVATEVTADLASARLSRKDIFRIAASVS